MNQGILEGFEEYTHPYGISGLQEQATMNLLTLPWLKPRDSCELGLLGFRRYV